MRLTFVAWEEAVGRGKKKSGVPSHAARTKPILSYEAKLLTLSVGVFGSF